MRLRDIMSEAVESIPPDAPVDQAREQMRRQDVRHLAVAARSSVSSQHDLRRAQGMAAVRSVMSASAVTATPQTSLREAANLLRGDHVSCLPVLDGRGSLIGMVTVSDLLDLIGKGVTREPESDKRRQRSWVPGR